MGHSTQRLGAQWLMAALCWASAGCSSHHGTNPQAQAKDDAGTPPTAGRMSSPEPRDMIPRVDRTDSGAANAGGGAAGTAGVLPDSAYQCKPPLGDRGGMAQAAASCCGGLGVCKSGESAGLPHDACAAQPDLRCVPVPNPETDADGGVDTTFMGCRLQLPGAPPTAPSYEGRCLPTCFVAGSPIANRLSQAGCSKGQVCSPCYNPLDGRATGICERSGDAPLDPPVVPLAQCADGLGYCVPSYAVGSSAAQLMQLTCAAGELCAPKNKVADPNSCFARCDAAALGPGACVPAFLAGLVAPLLSPDGCATGELCAPCEALGSRTGVCD
jgi:hypothetical protein